MKKSAWAAALCSFGLLAACGASKSAPTASTTSATQSPAGGTDWASLCKTAKTRASRCGISNQTVADCEKIDGCTEHPFDATAPAVLAKCLADSDCDACTKAASASPSAAGKAFLATAADYEKRCQRNDDMAALITKVGGLFNADSLKPFSDCMQMPSCDGAASCNAKLHMGDMSVMANSQCTDVLGLGVSGESASNMPPPPPPPTDLTGQPAPEISADAVGSSKILSMASLKGKVTLVIFFATYSTPSTKLVTDVDAFVKKNSKKGVVAIGVSVDDGMPAVQAFQQKSHVKMPLAFDSKKATAQAYSPSGLPTLYVVDRKGMVSDVEVMNIDMAKVAKAL